MPDLTMVFPSLLVLCLGLALLQWTTLRRIQSRMVARDQHIALLQNELRALLACSRGVGDTLHRQHKELRSLVQRQDQIEVGGDGGGGTAYRHAAALAERGASSQEIVKTCGLSQGEAELVAHLSTLRNQAASRA